MPSFSESISFAVFSYCAWEAIPTSEFSHELANWVTKIMMLPLLSLDIRGPSVFCLSLYTSTTFIGKMPRLVFRSEEEGESHMEQKYPWQLFWPSQPWVKPPDHICMSQMPAEAWGSPDEMCKSTPSWLMGHNNKCLFKPLEFDVIC